MARKYRPKPNVMKSLCCYLLVLLAIALGLWGTLLGSTSVPVMIGTSVLVAFVLTFWALGEHFLFSFGKSRYPTRTERKRLRHQRKKKAGGGKILGREIPERDDR